MNNLESKDRKESSLGASTVNRLVAGSGKIKALIVDDSFLKRSTVRKVLETYPNINEICEAEDGLDALNMVKEKELDVILLDIEMPNMDGIEFMKRIKFIPMR